ncbi:protein FAM107B-like [Hemicordylus capensis]|uniref:protein FAM107B-like n=1 Tax=Hemicordylus capensis TaxID=884348 RepID=UPI002304A825|nr:protein FAM107B-like [Hemicordylus capensis]XP_053106484.1 protein FAM107B-like [Hemicordylus capensis]
MGVSQSKRGEYKTQKNSLNPGADKSSEHGTYQASEIHRGLIEPKKLPNPVKESRHHRDLHRELLFTHRRGMFPEHKPELQRVLEARRIRQLKKQEENEKPLTDLEEELRKRQEKLDQYERELVLQGEQDGRPEFILVKESLRKIKLSTETTEIKLSTEGIRQT